MPVAIVPKKGETLKSGRELQLDVQDELCWEPAGNATDIRVSVKDGVVTLAFRRDALLDASQITVLTDGDKVTLKGSVRFWAERDDAETVAWAAPGVCEVKDDITVSC